jgi:hypothetical protein
MKGSNSMANTAQLGLPLVMPSQAQKHVTVNEALARLDAAAQLRVVSSVLETPPSVAADGESYLVPAGAAGDWLGKSGSIAVWSNGGWVFLDPKAGWRAWDENTFGTRVFDGINWLHDAGAFSPGGAGTVTKVLEADHTMVPGTSSPTGVVIPAMAQVLGITGRVTSALSGAGLSSWRIGVAASDNRYGSGLGLALNSYLIGLSGNPVTYYSETEIFVRGEGGEFAAGTIRLALHYLHLVPPRAV